MFTCYCKNSKTIYTCFECCNRYIIRKESTKTLCHHGENKRLCKECKIEKRIKKLHAMYKKNLNSFKIN